jgi:hypothetical protein
MRFTLIPIFVALFLFSGCTAQIRVAQEALSNAESRIALLEAAEAKAEQALATARHLAEVSGSDQAIQAVEIAEASLAALKVALPQAREAATAAKGVLSAAEAASRHSTLENITAILFALMGGGGAIWQAARAKKWGEAFVAVTRTAEAFKDRAEAIGVDMTAELKAADAVQKALKIKDMVDKARNT